MMIRERPVRDVPEGEEAQKIYPEEATVRGRLLHQEDTEPRAPDHPRREAVRTGAVRHEVLRAAEAATAVREEEAAVPTLIL